MSSTVRVATSRPPALFFLYHASDECERIKPPVPANYTCWTTWILPAVAKPSPLHNAVADADPKRLWPGKPGETGVGSTGQDRVFDASWGSWRGASVAATPVSRTSATPTIMATHRRSTASSTAPHNSGIFAAASCTELSSAAFCPCLCATRISVTSLRTGLGCHCCGAAWLHSKRRISPGDNPMCEQ